MIEIRTGFHFRDLTEVTVEMGKIEPEFKPTERELEMCPEEFVCFVCLDRKPKRKLGNLVATKWVCRSCRPHVDEFIVNGIAKFDDRQKLHHGSKPVPRKMKPIIPDDWEHISALDMVLLRLGGEEPETEWRDVVTKEPMKPDADMEFKIEEVKKTFALWEHHSHR